MVFLYKNLFNCFITHPAFKIFISDFSKKISHVPSVIRKADNVLYGFKYTKYFFKVCSF